MSISLVTVIIRKVVISHSQEFQVILINTYCSVKSIYLCVFARTTLILFHKSDLINSKKIRKCYITSMFLIIHFFSLSNVITELNDFMPLQYLIQYIK
jgi:hypothetical protein